jgi:hypothetical protein
MVRRLSLVRCRRGPRRHGGFSVRGFGFRGKTTTRWAVFAVTAMVMAGIPLLASSAGAQVASTTTVVVRKVVTGTGTGASTIALTCDGTSAETDFHFDAQGNPTTTSPSSPFLTIVNGAWQLSGPTDPVTKNCHFNETDAGGATSTSWTCTYTSTAIPVPTAEAVTPPGCSAASGSDTGPVNVLYQGSTAVSEQTSDVTFTNTFVAPPAPPAPPAAAPAVVLTPTFTG